MCWPTTETEDEEQPDGPLISTEGCVIKHIALTQSIDAIGTKLQLWVRLGERNGQYEEESDRNIGAIITTFHRTAITMHLVYLFPSMYTGPPL
ncbi:hypothetical protein L1887_02834 [Cichorium endivia]|nr:hypothetical protein L1887_02834 [Cichorium endivia]